MEKRPLGFSGIEIPPLVFGGNVLGWTMDRAQSFAVLDAFMDHGFTAIDTADVYFQLAEGGVGTSERILGEWLGARRSRDRVVVATKVGLPMGKDNRGLSRGYIVKAVEASLARLQTDYIDLYQAHCDDTRVEQEETLEAFESLVRAGKVRALGASNIPVSRMESARTIAETNGWTGFATGQPLYNLFDRDDFEAGMQGFCAENAIGVLPYFSLASGFLTGKYRSAEDLEGAERGAFVKKYLTEAGLKLLSAMDEVAQKHGASNAQIAVAWLLTQPTIVAPVASATTVPQLEQLAGALDLNLDAEDLAKLDAARVPAEARQ